MERDETSAAGDARSAEAELGRILDASLNEIFVFDAESLRFELVNQGARRNLGYTNEELTQLTPFDLTPEFSEQQFREHIAPLASGGAPKLSFETTHQRKDRSEYAVEVSLQLDSFHGRRAYVAVTQDLTSRKEIERSLEQSERQSQSVLDTAVNPIITIDEDCIIISANPATEQNFGYSQEELIGKNVNMLMPSPFREEHNDYVANYLRTGERKIIGIGREVVAQRKDGSRFPMDLSVGEVKRPGGKRLFTGIIRDVTERKRLEDELLTVSEKERRAIGREIHDDLCQRFFGVGCLVEVLQAKSGDLPDEFQQGISELSRLVRDANARAREMSHGLMPVALVADGLMSALEDLADATTRTSGIHCDFRCETPVLIEDENASIQLFRISQEAVKNAVKHGSPRRIEIELSTSGENLLLEIRDNGIGLPDGSDKSKGMGFLTMSHRARTLGGTCEIRSQQGVIVTCAVPLASLLPKAGGCPVFEQH